MQLSFLRLNPSAQLPIYQTADSAAADIMACLDESLTLQSGDRAIIPTGFALAVPVGYEAQIRARSGLSLNHGICLANGVGTIDSDYRGEVGVILINNGDEPFVVEPGMRIAQLIVAKCERIEWKVVDKLDVTERGKAGYGSTGY